MRKILLSKILISIAILWIVFPIVHAYASTEVLQVSSLNSTPVYSNTILESGKMYLIEASGTYTYAPGNRIADAEFAYNPDTNSWQEDFGNIYEQYVLDLIVNGQPQDWLGSTNGVDYYPHTFSPDHVYKLYATGLGQPISFYIFDRSYDWNEGGLTVSISSVLPADKIECKKDGWKLYPDTFNNQGQCIKSVNLH